MGLQVVVRADASASIGVGHRVRSEVLEHFFSKLNAQVTFVVHESCVDHSKPRDFLYQEECEWHDLARQADILILDHYGYDAAAIYGLYQLNANLLILDDNNDRGDLHCRWVLNPLPLMYSQTVHMPLIGGEYALLRSQFLKSRTDVYFDRTKLLITFGGTDPMALTLPFIKSLVEKGFSTELLMVMVGEKAQNVKVIESYCRQLNIECLIGVNEVSELMARSRYAISAAGGTLFELACMGVPAHFIQVADNQKDALEQHVALGWCTATNFTSVTDTESVERISDIVDHVMRVWQKELRECSLLASQCIDGRGAERVVETVLATRLVEK